MNFNNEKIITALLRRFKIEYNKKDYSSVYGYTQKSMTYNSNKMEGGKLTFRQLSLLFDTMSISGDGEFLRLKDIEEASGHFLMFNDMLKTFNDELTEQLIKKYHYDLKYGVFEDTENGYEAYDYKTMNNIVSNINVASPSEVSKKMKDLLEEYNTKKEHTLDDIVEFHAKFELIHPFQDGNGRTGRIIMFKECLKNNIFPFIIEDDLKVEYFNALNKAQLENKYDDLVELCHKEQEIYFNNVANFIYTEEELDDLRKELNFNGDYSLQKK